MVEGVVVGVVLAGAIGLALGGVRLWMRALLAGGSLAACVVLGLVLAAPSRTPHPALPGDHTTAPDADYASSDTCRACHPDAWSTWHDTYHRTMTRRADAAAIVAPWQGELTAGGRRYRLIREDERFFVDAPRPGTTGETASERQRLPVVMTTGSHHMQLYWVPVPWAEEGDLPGSARLFAERCQSCHEDLAGRRTPPHRIEEAIERHRRDGTVEVGDAEAARLRHFTERLVLPGRLQQFPFAWWIREGRWVHEEQTFLQPPEEEPDVEHWEQTWGDGCDQCHSVGPRTTWRADGPTLDEDVAELGIACEACHGPAAAHAAAYRDPLSRYAARLSDAPAEHIVNPGRLDHERATAVCAQCHAELVRHDEDFEAFPVGEPLSAWARLVQHQEVPYEPWLAEVLADDPGLLASAFWRDGTMRVAGRDTNGMVLSGCYTEGELSCLTCHDLHGGSRDDNLREGARGDAMCVDCHPEQGAAGAAHTHHPVDSEGSRCMNCHMPHTTLGLLGAMRAHRIDSPDAMRTYTKGRPDACTLCHLDKPLTWTARALADWYGHEVPPIAGDGRATAVDGLLRGDAAQRAVYAWHMGWAPAREASGDEWEPAILAQALDDPYAAVRSIAGQSLHAIPGYEDVEVDFTAEGSTRRAQAEAVMTRWQERGGAEGRREVFMTPEGLDTGLVGLLQTLRDDRPVTVSE